MARPLRTITAAARRRMAEIVRGLREPSRAELQRALDRASRTSFSRWNNELYRQMARLAAKQALRVVGGNRKQMYTFLRASEGVMEAFNRGGGRIDKISEAAALRQLASEISLKKMKNYNFVFGHATNKVRSQIEREKALIQKSRDSVGLPPDSEIREVLLRSAHAGQQEMQRTLPDQILELATKHAFKAVDGEPEKLADAVRAVNKATLGQEAETGSQVEAIRKAVGNKNIARFTETYLRNINHITGKIQQIADDADKQK